jgi:hypothetical protein
MADSSLDSFFCHFFWWWVLVEIAFFLWNSPWWWGWYPLDSVEVSVDLLAPKKLDLPLEPALKCLLVETTFCPVKADLVVLSLFRITKVLALDFIILVGLVLCKNFRVCLDEID